MTVVTNCMNHQSVSHLKSSIVVDIEALPYYIISLMIFKSEFGNENHEVNHLFQFILIPKSA